MSTLPKSSLALINNEYMLRRLSEDGAVFSHYSARRSGSRLDIDIVIIPKDVFVTRNGILFNDGDVKTKGTSFEEIKQMTIGNGSHLRINVGDFYLPSDVLDGDEFKRIIENLKSSDEVADSEKAGSAADPLTGEPPQQEAPKKATTPRRKKTLMLAIAVIVLLTTLFFVFNQFNKKMPPPAKNGNEPQTRATIQPSDAQKIDHKEDFYSAGKRYFDAGEFDKSFNAYLKSAEMNNPNGMIAVAHLYEIGKGTKKNIDKAADWYFKAAQKKNSEAAGYIKKLSDASGMMFDKIAQCYENGYGVDADQEEALVWYVKSFESGNKEALIKIVSAASEKNSSKAQVYLAEYYSNAGNNIEAEKYYSLVFKNGSRDFNEKFKGVLLKAALEKYKTGDMAGGDLYLKKAESLLRLSLIDLKDSRLLFYYGKSLLEKQGMQKNIFIAEKFLEKAYLAGNPEAKATLAAVFLQIANIKKAENKEDEFRDYLKKAVRLGNQEALSIVQSAEYDIVIKEMNSNQEKAIPALAVIAEDGNHKYRNAAQKMLGEYYFKNKHWEDAEKWFLLSSKDGEVKIKLNLAICQYNLGLCYELGDGVVKDMSKAVKWYRKAAEQEYAHAQYALGKCYYSGNGVDKDIPTAIVSFRKAAEQGQVDAQRELGLYYVMIDSNESAKWFGKAAEQGDALAQYHLGLCYYNGDGVAKDEATAVKWFRKAVEKELAKAQYNLGECYLRGKGVAQNSAIAVEWYRKAAEQGNAEAQYWLGVLYENGEGVTTDQEKSANWYHFSNRSAQCQEKAVEWYRKAAEQGLAKAQCNLGVCYENGEGVAKDQAIAVQWYRKAAEQGLALAQYNLGLLYEKGDGVDKDITKAVDWYRKAAGQGHKDAVTRIYQLKR